MKALADVIAGHARPANGRAEAELRLLGYAASLVKGSVRDEAGRLGVFLSACRRELEGLPEPAVSPRDPVQRRWGAAFHLDARKLKHELPLHLMRSSAPKDSSASAFEM